MNTLSSFRSFRQSPGLRPPDYRTPSPPNAAIEPLSPLADGQHPKHLQSFISSTTHGLGLSLSDTHGSHSFLDQQVWNDANGRGQYSALGAAAGKNHAPRRHTFDEPRVTSRKEGAQKRDRKGHSRTGSNMDALATIALATSPTFSQAGSPILPQDSWSQYIYSNGYQHDYTLDERPSKRARSEKLPSPQMSHKQSRPATSHVPSFENMQNDAELLLNFAQNQHFSALKKEINAQGFCLEDEASPSYKRLSASTTASEQMDGVEHSAGHAEANNGTVPENQENGLQAERSTSPKHEQDTMWLDSEQKTGTSGADGLSNTYAEPLNTFTGMSTFEEQLIASAAEIPLVVEKKVRRVQPVTQAPCATCKSVTAAVDTGDQDGLTSWIGCHVCTRWFHFICAGFSDSREVRSVDKYICPDCEPEHGPTTFVRKSSRARTAIDYAGLNQGMIQSSEATPEHHWLKMIKDGSLKFQPDDFARMRPELITMDYLEKTDGLKRPIVIPAHWNAQFGHQRTDPTPTENDAPDIDREMAIDNEGNEIPLKSLASALPTEEEVADCGQDSLDMVMPENLTVRRVADLHGRDMPLDVIDVKSQQTAQKWNLKKWADYYEASGDKTIRNVISLEVSQSKLGKLLKRPKIVRDIDLQDSVWPADVPVKGVQFYCLMSVADCYTDFHIDFGGSSVYYHILKGKKTFFFIPPEEKHLKKYESWNNSPLQNQTFLGQVTGDCVRVDLSQGDTMLIPSGWIHAVWTPENSLVIGGNFLTRLSYEMQIKINKIEIDTKTALKFRYPLFQKVNWYAAIRYLEEDPTPEEVTQDFEDDPDHVFLRANPVWHEFGELANETEPGDPYFNTRFYSRMEMEGLPALRDYLYRTALIASDYDVDGITETKRANVKKSVPKGHGEPMDMIRAFGIWVAWKTGCVTAPDWVRPDSSALSSLSRKADKPKKVEAKPPGERVSSRVQTQLENARIEAANTPVKVEGPEEEKQAAKRPKRTPKTSGLGPQRFACDACRKRRIRCRHREGENTAPKAGGALAKTTNASISVDIPQTPSKTYPSLDGALSSPLSKSTQAPADSKVYTTPIPLKEVNGINTQGTQSHLQAQDATPVSSGKKGRSKACDECRKSKRRCIHDENGKVDPFKAAEPSKPRGSTSQKRPSRLSIDFQDPEIKATKDLLSTPSPANVETEAVEDGDFDALLDPSLCPAVQDEVAIDTVNHATQGVTESTEQALDEAAPQQSQTDTPSQAKLTIHADPLNPSSPTIKAEAHASTLPTSSSQMSANSLVSPPDSIRDDNDQHHNPDDFSPTQDRNVTEVTDSTREAIASSNESSVSSSISNPLQTPKSAASRHSSRQPKPVDRYIPEPEPTPKQIVNPTSTTQGSAGKTRQDVDQQHWRTLVPFPKRIPDEDQALQWVDLVQTLHSQTPPPPLLRALALNPQASNPKNPPHHQVNQTPQPPP